MSRQAIWRAVDRGDAWIPLGLDLDKLGPRIETLRQYAAERGKACPEVIAMGALPSDDGEALERLQGLSELGITQYIQSSRYFSEQEFDSMISNLF